MLESLKELFSSSVSTATQRVKNPALGAFALSWCAFNWKSILYLLFSDTKIYNRIEFISAHSDWKISFGYPVLSTIILCGFMPWVNNFVAKWQSKPLINADAIEGVRYAHQFKIGARLQRMKARQDVTYERYKTHAEEELQEMRANILKSQEITGQITKERDAAVAELSKAKETLANFELLDKDRIGQIEGANSQVSQLTRLLEQCYYNLRRNPDDKSQYDLANYIKTSLENLNIKIRN